MLRGSQRLRDNRGLGDNHEVCVAQALRTLGAKSGCLWKAARTAGFPPLAAFIPKTHL